MINNSFLTHNQDAEKNSRDPQLQRIKKDVVDDCIEGISDPSCYGLRPHNSLKTTAQPNVTLNVDYNNCAIASLHFASAAVYLILKILPL